MAKAKFCLIVDTEADFWRYIPSPHFSRREVIKWYLNKIFRSYRFARGRQGLVNLVRVLKKYKFPTTFTIVGHLYLKSCKGYPHFKEKVPEARWLKRLIGKRWDYWDPKSNCTSNSGLYAGDFIEKEMKVPFFDLGLHAFAHESLTLEKKETVKESIESAVKASKSIGIKPISFGAPFNMIEDSRDPKRIYSILKKSGIRIIRYAGTEEGLRQNHFVAIKKPFKIGGLTAIHVSHYFEGNSSLNHIKKIIKEIKEASNKDVIYCLNTHDFTHKDTRNLQIIINKVLELEQEGKLKIVSMKQILKGKI